MSKRNSNSGQSRIVRVNDEMQKEISQIINFELKDPRLDGLITVVNVDTTKDLSYSKVYVSVLGDDEKKKEVLEGLVSSQGYIRREIAKRINLRVTPEIKFLLDDSIEYSMKMAKLIKEASDSIVNRDEDE